MAACYERMPEHDMPFLAFEGPGAHMHIGGTAILEAGPVALPGWGVSLENGPVWIDDEHFNPNYHVRHTALPRPGDEEQLRQLSGHIFSQQLDRGKPLWELWVVEALAGSFRELAELAVERGRAAVGG